MGTVRVSREYPGTVHEAEARWYDTGRWPEWVSGMARVVAVEGDWPHPGSTVRWESGPAGRGRVFERAVEYEKLAGQTLEVEDDSITGRQRISFMPIERGALVELSLDYRLKRQSILTPVVDLLFIRRAMATSLDSTLQRFASAR